MPCALFSNGHKDAVATHDRGKVESPRFGHVFGTFVSNFTIFTDFSLDWTPNSDIPFMTMFDVEWDFLPASIVSRSEKELSPELWRCERVKHDN